MKDHLVYYDEIRKLHKKLDSFIKYDPTDQEVDQFLKRNFQFVRDEQSSFFGRKPEEFEHLWEELEDEEKHELARPLSARQLFCAECVMNPYNKDTLSRLWDFLHDNGQIENKNIMSMAEIAFFAMMLERIYTYLA